MIPISDVIPSRTAPIVTMALIVVNLLIFLYERSLPDPGLPLFIGQFALIPAEFHWPALFTSQFLHAGWAHVLPNMLYLWIFGDNVEDRLGHGRFLGFYLFAGAAAAILQMVFNPFSAVPMVGASGAISGVLGAYLLMFPRAHVLVLLPLGPLSQLVRMPALLVLGLWFGMQLLSEMFTPPGAGVAFRAHIGGFVAGLVLMPLFRRRG